MSIKTISTNRKARFNYAIGDTYEAGISLLGSEVKSLRLGHADLKDSYATVRGGEMWVVGLRISPYEYARDGGHDPERERKLLLHKREIEKIGARAAEKGLSLVPLSLYFKDGKVKLEIGLGKGKTQRDKRETLRRRQADREMQKAMRHRSLD